MGLSVDAQDHVGARYSPGLGRVRHQFPQYHSSRSMMLSFQIPTRYVFPKRGWICFTIPAKAGSLSVPKVRFELVYCVNIERQISSASRSCSFVINPNLGAIALTLAQNCCFIFWGTPGGSPSGNVSEAHNSLHSQNNCLRPKCKTLGARRRSWSTQALYIISSSTLEISDGFSPA